MRWPGLGEVSPPRGMTASGSSESLLTGLFQPARTWSLVFWAPLLTVTVPRVSVVDASTVKPRPTPRGSHLPRAHVTQTSVSPARGVVALCPPGGPRPKHRRATAVAVCRPSRGACAQPGTRTSTAGRRRAQGVTCVAAKATVSAPPGSGLHTGFSQRESSRVQSASVLPVSGVRAGGEHPCAPGERARLSVSAPARGFLTARKRPPWAALGPEETRLEAPVF